MSSRLEQDIEYLKRELKHHKGKWLDEAAVKECQQRAAKLSASGPECVGERRKLCLEIMEEYGLLEIEALNIINGHNAVDYVAKYKRIRTQTPLKIRER